MGALKDTVVTATSAKVQIVRVKRETASYWNAQRKEHDTRVFCGYYWLRGNEEGGPFPNWSAAMSDAYYKFVLNRELRPVAGSVFFGTTVKPQRKTKRKDKEVRT